jgi:uncharacterized protein involved in exopolysaccharide biosynthesis
MMQQESATPGLSLLQIWSIVWAYKKHAAVIAAVIIVLTAVFIKLMAKTYSATATLMVNYEVNDPLAGQGPLTPVFAYMSTEVQLMQSAEVLLPVIERLNLTENKLYTAGYRGGSLADAVQEKLVKDLEIEPGRAGGQLIFVTASAADPVLAAQIANAVVETYLSQERQRTSGPASERAKRYAKELAELKDKVNIAQDQVTQFRQRSGVTDAASRNTNVDADLLAGLENRLQEAQNARRAAEIKAASDQHLSSDAATSGTIITLRTQINTEQVQLAQLRATMGVRHPKVIELQNQINENQRILDSEFNKFSAGASADLTGARQLEAKLQAAVQDQRNKVLAVNRVQDEGTKYVLELESAQSVYKRALDGYDQIMFASGGNANKMNMVSRAVPPQKATKPNKLKLFIMGIFAAVFLGVAAPIAYELILDRRIRCPDDFERGFAVPVLMEFGPITTIRSAA